MSLRALRHTFAALSLSFATGRGMWSLRRRFARVGQVVGQLKTRKINCPQKFKKMKKSTEIERFREFFELPAHFRNGPSGPRRLCAVKFEAASRRRICAGRWSPVGTVHRRPSRQARPGFAGPSIVITEGVPAGKARRYPRIKAEHFIDTH